MWQVEAGLRNRCPTRGSYACTRHCNAPMESICSCIAFHQALAPAAALVFPPRPPVTLNRAMHTSPPTACPRLRSGHATLDPSGAPGPLPLPAWPPSGTHLPPGRGPVDARHLSLVQLGGRARGPGGGSWATGRGTGNSVTRARVTQPRESSHAKLISVMLHGDLGVAVNRPSPPSTCMATWMYSHCGHRLVAARPQHCTRRETRRADPRTSAIAHASMSV